MNTVAIKNMRIRICVIRKVLYISTVIISVVKIVINHEDDNGSPEKIWGRPIYQKFLESGKTVRKFCSDEGIEEGRFYHWQAKVRMEAAKGTGEFLPVSINNRGGKVAILGSNGFGSGNASSIQPICEIVYPNGVKIRFSGNINPEAVTNNETKRA